MRRFVAYLSLAIAGIATIGATFNSAIIDSTSNIEYSDGKEMVFRISNKDKDEEIADDENASEQIASLMQKRLDIYGETRYDVVTLGNDMVKVVLSEDQQQYYNEIETYLSFNGEFALGTTKGEPAIGDEFMDPDRDCYVDFVNHYPTVVIPVNTESEQFKAVIKEAEEMRDEHKDDEIPEGEEAPRTYVYLAYNFVEGKDTISSLVEGSDDYDAEKAAKKLLLQFDINSIYLNDEKNAIATSVNIVDENGNTSINRVQQATHTANHTVNLLNSEPLPYEVECVMKSNVPAYFEEIISLNNTVAWSRTLTATLFAILILSLLLAVFFRWGAVAIGALSVAATYLGLILAIVFTVEFNTAAIVGLCAVALASIASGIIYMTKVKEECYRGRTLKKANAEGAKRALLPIVDINLILIIIGACVYWLGGVMMTSFAAVTVFGGIFSLLFNTLALKGMMWLLTNTTKFQGNYTVIGVENSKVPNILNEESQTYYGPYQDSNPTKHKKVYGIISAVLFIASLVGTITFGALNGGVIFNDKDRNIEKSYLIVETINESSEINEEAINKLLANSQYIEYKENPSEKDWENAKRLTFTIDKKDPFADKVDDNDVIRTYYVVTFDQYISSKDLVRVYKNADDIGNADKVYLTGTIDDIFVEYNTVNDIDGEASAKLRQGVIVSAQQPDYTWIIIGTVVGVAFTALYLMLRYGLARGLVTLMATTLTGFVTAGVFTLTRVLVGLDLFISLPLIMMFTLILATILMNKEKEMMFDDRVKNKDHSKEHLHELSIKSNALALGPILVFTAMGIYLMVNFFGFGVAATSNIFMFAMIGILISAVVVSILYTPTVEVLRNLFSKINIKKPDIKKNKKKNKKKVVKAKSAEPEEAIFIGIND